MLLTRMIGRRLRNYQLDGNSKWNLNIAPIDNVIRTVTYDDDDIAYILNVD
jgi:hypothetical protein